MVAPMKLENPDVIFTKYKEKLLEEAKFYTDARRHYLAIAAAVDKIRKKDNLGIHIRSYDDLINSSDDFRVKSLIRKYAAMMGYTVKEVKITMDSIVNNLEYDNEDLIDILYYLIENKSGLNEANDLLRPRDETITKKEAQKKVDDHWEVLKNSLEEDAEKGIADISKIDWDELEEYMKRNWMKDLRLLYNIV